MPAAGYARRLQPLATSKEMVPVGGRPVMDYLLERLRSARCTEILVVTRPDKLDVIDHARRSGAHVVLARPATLGASIRAGMAGLPPDAIVLVGFPDTIWQPPDGFRTLRSLVAAGRPAVLGLFTTADPARSEVVRLGADDRILAIERAGGPAPTAWIWGGLAARRPVLDDLPATPSLAHWLMTLARLGVLSAARLGDLVDIGVPEALAAARRSAATSAGVVRGAKGRD